MLKRYLLALLAFFSAISANSQACPDVPNLEDMEVVCDYEDPINLDLAVYPLEGEWTVTPDNGNVFVYLGWLYYQQASPGDYVLDFEITDPSPGCPTNYQYNVQLITTALVWPIPHLICPDDVFYVGDVGLSEEGFHEVYLPAEICDSLVQVILLHDDSVCIDESDGEDPELNVELQDEEENETSEQSSNSEPGVSSGGGPNVNDEEVTEIESTGSNNDTFIDGGPEVGPIQTPSTADYSVNEMIFPTAFSPDYNGINDTFGLINNDLEFSYYSISVYDRWGSLVFSSQDPLERWNGICRGKEVSNGAYTFVVKAMTQSGQEVWNKGAITLIR